MQRHGKAILLAVVTLGLTACAGEPYHSEEGDANLAISKDAARIVNEKGEATAAKAGSEESKKSDLICERVERTGSHMSQTYCYSRREAERNKERTQDQVRSMQRGPSKNLEGGPPSP